MANAMRIALGAGCIFGACVLAACGSSSSPTPPSTSDGGTTTAWRAAVGAGGVLVQTFDDATWKARTVTPGALRAVTCVGNLHGWAAGDGGFVAHTDDGGATWVTEDSQLAGDLHAIRFVDGATGIVVGDAGALAVTHDGGAHWSATPPLTGATLRGAAAARSLLLAVGDGGVVLRSIDGGATFAVSRVDGAGDLRGVASDSEAHVVYAVDARGGIWSSVDRGQSFALAAAARGPLEAISVTDDGARAIAAGQGGLALVRAASGFTEVALPIAADLHAALAEPGAYYVAGEAGALLESRDGVTFTARATGTTSALYALDDL